MAKTGHREKSKWCSRVIINRQFLYLPPAIKAQMAKLVDALPSGGSVRKDVLVRIQFWALKKQSKPGLLF